MASCVRASFPAGKARVARGLERGATGGIIFRLCNTNKKEKKHTHVCAPSFVYFSGLANFLAVDLWRSFCLLLLWILNVNALLGASVCVWGGGRGFQCASGSPSVHIYFFLCPLFAALFYSVRFFLQFARGAIHGQGRAGVSMGLDRGTITVTVIVTVYHIYR